MDAAPVWNGMRAKVEADVEKQLRLGLPRPLYVTHGPHLRQRLMNAYDILEVGMRKAHAEFGDDPLAESAAVSAALLRLAAAAESIACEIRSLREASEK